jgi:arginyl-tRNA synthetase
LDEWTGIAGELELTNRELLTRIVDAIKNDGDPENAVQEIGRKYESNDPDTVRLVRKVTDIALDGIRATMAELGVQFDVWDWESQLLWTGQVDSVLQRLLKLPFTTTTGASATLDVNEIVETYSLRSFLNLSDTYEIPQLTLVRSDGTTLYPIRDIAYSLFKFKESKEVVNVIASEQKLPQLQIRIALYAMGERDAAKNLIHYAYGLVELPGEKMSKRRARYIALDDVIAQAKRRVEEEMTGRSGELGKEESKRIANSIALGAIKFAMLNVNSMKNLTFTWERVLSLEQNSAPFINYAYTRAGSILRKITTSNATDPAALTHPLEHLLLYKIAQMPDIFSDAADQMKPEDLANYANSIAEKFHEYYERVDVIHADEHVKNARGMLVKAIQIVLGNSMRLLGIALTDRM